MSDVRDPLATDHLVDDLKARSVRGGALTVVAQVLKYGVDIVAIAVLARLLTPGDFGLVAMVAAVVGFLATFKDAGLSAATIQRENVSHDQVSTLFWVNVAASFALAIIIAAVAPGVAWFYGEARLVEITIAMGSGFIFAGLMAQHLALIKRQMRFRALAWVEVGAHVVAAVAGVAAALAGWGYWALVVRGVTSSFVQMIAVWVVEPWRPDRPRRAAGSGSLVRFGGYITAFQAVNYVGRNLDNVLIGRVLGGATLGIYSKAYQLLMLPLRMVNGPISAVALPALSRLQSNPERLRSYYYKALALIVTLSMPVVAWVASVSDSLVLTMLGPQWVEAIDIFRILTIPAFIGTFNVATGWVFVALGHVRRQMFSGIANTAVGVVAIVVGLRWGIEGVAWALVVSSVARRLPTIAYCYHGTPFTLAGLFAVLWWPATAAMLAGAATFHIHAAFAPGTWPPLALAASFPIFAAVYLGALLALPGGRERVGELIGHARLLRGRPAEALG
ncbi:MAG: lipopolysaccharide biosynthesis protein [Deltaproteobacteria bacterium]|nr:lipopolysaccharide biosynthesis protein [Deltaproteobacteria bacterium]